MIGHYGDHLQANLFTGAKHATFSTNHLADIDKLNITAITNTKNLNNQTIKLIRNARPNQITKA